jgi:hypothetical protein
MVEVAVHTFISAPRDDIFEFVSDMAARVAFLDHFVHEYRLTRPRSSGVGAAARYRLEAPPLFTHYAETAIVEMEPPRRIVEEGEAGRYGRIRTGARWDFAREGTSLTRVDLLHWLDGGMPRERVKLRLGFEGWLRRQEKTALERLRLIFEEPPEEPLARATIAGFEPEKAVRFGS